MLSLFGAISVALFVFREKKRLLPEPLLSPSQKSLNCKRDYRSNDGMGMYALHAREYVAEAQVRGVWFGKAGGCDGCRCRCSSPQKEAEAGRRKLGFGYQ